MPLHHPADGPPPPVGEAIPILADDTRAGNRSRRRVSAKSRRGPVSPFCAAGSRASTSGFSRPIRQIEQVSLADIVLSGGEPAALAILDACIRLLPGVMGAPDSGVEESYENGLIEYPQYTRPAEWEGRTIPEVLRSGDHAKIAAWRKARSEEDTRLRRPDLWERYSDGSGPVCLWRAAKRLRIWFDEPHSAARSRSYREPREGRFPEFPRAVTPVRVGVRVVEGSRRTRPEFRRRRHCPLEPRHGQQLHRAQNLLR